ncbi:MAG: hypothetical protein PF481_07415 [Bacteroidales bacterium]|nr:hypothetical protein [Bacteroidales bacterium]
MKKILILAYDFPPYNSIGGQRPYSWFRYFKNNNLKPIVITRHWDNNIQNPVDYITPSSISSVTCEESDEGIIYRVPFKPNLRDSFILRFGNSSFSYIRKILSLWYILTEFFIPFFDSKRKIYQEAKKICAQHSISCIVATGEPFILFAYASRLSKKTKVPWIADYRDGWSSNYNRSRMERMLYQKLENTLVRSASCITTVSEPLQKDLQTKHNKPVHIISNGYFEYPTQVKDHKNEYFTICYSGTLYSYQEIEVFLAGFYKFIENRDRSVRIVFWGMEFYEEQKQRILSYNKILTHLSRQVQKLNVNCCFIGFYITS